MKKILSSFLFLCTASLAVATTLPLPLSYTPSADEHGHVLITDFESFNLGQELDKTIVSGVGTCSMSVSLAEWETRTGNKAAKIKNEASSQIRYLKMSVTLPQGKSIADYLYLEYDFLRVASSNQVFSIRLDETLIYNESTTMSPSPASNLWYRRMIPLEGLSSSNVINLEIGLSSAVEYYLDNIRLISKENSFKVDDFEEKALETTYSTSSASITATVKADPWGLPISGSKKSTKCLEVVNSGGGVYPQFSVTLPQGKKLSDYSDVIFSAYASTSNFGNGLRVNVRMASTIPIGTETNSIAFNANNCWITRKYNIATINTELGELNSFTLQIGANAGSSNAPFTYYINNIYLINKNAVPSSVNSIEEFKTYISGGKGTLEIIPNEETSVTIFGIDGQIKFNARITTSTSIPLSKGVYLVQIGESVIKRIVE